MEEQEEKKELKEVVNSNNALLEKNIRLNKRKIIADVILVVVILALGIYVVMNLEAFKSLSQDVCQLCMDKTGASCIITNYQSNLSP